MARISVRTAVNAQSGSAHPALLNADEIAIYFTGPDQPLHLHGVHLGADKEVRVEAGAIDHLLFVWKGTVEAGGYRLACGSSAIIERGAHLIVNAREGAATVLVFAAAEPTQHLLPGGNIYLLPADRAPQSDSLGGSPGLGGVMHADGDLATCSLWLHQNHFAGNDQSGNDAEAGVHSHSEDEIIFVTDGEIRLGNKLHGPGTAIAIAADTLYSFTAGPTGLRFVNFRAAKPGDIRFAKGPSISETQYWRERLPRPSYLVPMA